MSSKCVFCGEKPINKNLEHILPQWLLKFTGNPKRVVNHGFNYENGKLLSFSFDSLATPSCTVCNDKFSKLEDLAKDLILKLSEKKELNAKEIIILFDWLDKVRIGLWLNYYYLEKNKAGISPKFAISNRIGKKDRFLQIHFLTSQNENQGLNAFGSNTFIFQFNPSCFALRINNLLLINGSNDFIVSKSCGFPYFKDIKLDTNGHLSLKGLAYDRETSIDFINSHFHKAPLTILQPIQTDINFGSNFYRDSYIIDNCLDIDNQIGGLFRILDNKIEPIGDEEVIIYENVTGIDIKFIGQLVASVYLAQNSFFRFYVDNNKIEDFEPLLSINIEYAEYHEHFHLKN